MTWFPWQTKTQRRLGAYERVTRGLLTWFSRLERKADDMAELMEQLKKEVDEMRDAVASILSTVNLLATEIKWLKNHPVIKEDPELAEVAQGLDGMQAAIRDAIAKVGASAEVAEGEPPVNTMSKKTA